MLRSEPTIPADCRTAGRRRSSLPRRGLQLIQRTTVINVGVKDEAEIFQSSKRAVHRTRSETGNLGTDLVH